MNTFLEDFATGVSHRMIWTVLKPTRDMWLCWLTIFIIKKSWDVLFLLLKKTIVLYLVKKFETFMVIFTSGRRRVFFKKTCPHARILSVISVISLMSPPCMNVDNFFTFSSWMRRYWFYVKNDSKFSSNLYVLRPPESEKTVFTKVSICLSVCSRSC